MRAIEPLAPERYRIQLTAATELKQKLEQCRDLMRHANPGGDFALIIERALELLLDQLMRERFGRAQRPRAAAKRSATVHLTQATRRAVVARDGLRCTWVSEDGQRCNSAAWLELDHVEPLARGGGSEPEQRARALSQSQSAGSRGGVREDTNRRAIGCVDWPWISKARRCPSEP